MSQELMQLENTIINTAKDNGVLLVGSTRIYKTSSVIVLGLPFNENWKLSYSLSFFKRVIEEYTFTKPLLNNFKEILNNKGYEVVEKTALTMIGDLRPLAAEAGLGQWGRNGLVINKKYSSGMLLMALITDAPVNIEQKAEELNCSECNLCIELCPAGALNDGKINYKKCLPYSIKGCSQCLKACGYAIDVEY